MKTNSQQNLQNAINDIQTLLSDERTARQDATDALTNAENNAVVLDLNNEVIVKITTVKADLEALTVLLTECDFNIPK